MIYTKGQEVVVNRQNVGQFLATVLEDFDTEKDTHANLKPVNGNPTKFVIKVCKFRLSESTK